MPNSRFLLAVMVALISACGSDDVTGTKLPTGVFSLERVNGARVPVVVEQTITSVVEVTSGSFSLAANGTFVAEVKTRESDGPTTVALTYASTGTFTATGTQLRFAESETGMTYTGVLANGRLTATRDGVTYDFVRQ
jgi:hypothetical protein